MLSRQVEQLENRFRDLGDTIPPEVWAELRPLVNELGHIQEQVAGLETQAVINPSPADGATANVQQETAHGQTKT